MKSTQLERLSVAMSSSNLTMYEHKMSDIDYVLALGIAQSRTGESAGPLSRLYLSSSRAGLWRAFESVLTVVKRLGLRRNWRLTQDEAKTVAKQALLHHIAPGCACCSGRGYEVHPGSPSLSDRACKVCKGTGRRPVQKRLRPEILQVIIVLEHIDSVTESAVARLIR